MRTRPPTHRQVVIEHAGEKIPIDEDLVPLVKELWRAGLATSNSCQEHEGTDKVWIEFVHPDDARRFLNRAVPQDATPRSMWSRATDWGFGSTMRAPMHLREGDWEYHTSVTDFAYDPEKGFRHDTHGFVLKVSVLFPRSDLDAVTEQVRFCNDTNKFGEPE